MIYGFIILNIYIGSRLKHLVQYLQQDRIVLFIMMKKIIELFCLEVVGLIRLDIIQFMYLIGILNFGVKLSLNV